MFDLKKAQFRELSDPGLASLGMAGQTVISVHRFDAESNLGGHYPFVKADDKKFNYRGHNQLVDDDILYVRPQQGEDRMPERQAAKSQPALV